MKMYKLIRLSAALCIGLLISCKNGDKTEHKASSTENSNKTEDVVDDDDNEGLYVENLRKHKSRLNGLEPVEQKRIANWFPDQIGDMVRVKLKEGDNGFPNASVARAYYSNKKGGNQVRRLDIEIMDGAGPQGSMVVPGLIARKDIDLDEEDDKQVSKYVKHGDFEATETYRKDSGGTVLTFHYNERFGITVRGERLNPEETWGYVDQTNFSQLLEILN